GQEDRRQRDGNPIPGPGDPNCIGSTRIHRTILMRLKFRTEAWGSSRIDESAVSGRVTTRGQERSETYAGGGRELTWEARNRMLSGCDREKISSSRLGPFRRAPSVPRVDAGEWNS